MRVEFLLPNRKYCIEHEKQWDFLKDLTANIADMGMEEEGEEGGAAPKKSRYAHVNGWSVKAYGGLVYIVHGCCGWGGGGGVGLMYNVGVVFYGISNS